MTDLEERLRETLRRKAVAVPPKREVPPGLVRRALARIARNVSAAAVALAIVAMGTVTAVHALSGPSQNRLATAPPPAPACQAINLSGASKLTASDPATREGYLSVANRGSSACSLQGQPGVRVVNPTGFALSLRSGSVEPLWKVRGMVPPPGWPVVTLQPGDTAMIHVKWVSWCPRPPSRDTDPTNWQIEFAGSGGAVEFPVTGQDVPTCVQGRDPTLKTGPFEPYSP